MLTDEKSTETPRLVSLDQFRGYTVAGMFLVNFVGGFAVVKEVLPILKHHHTYCSYADTIMPQFFFAVGFAYRMTLLRRIERHGSLAAYGHAVRRIFALLLVALLVHGIDGRAEAWSTLRDQGFWGFLTTSFQRNFFQTLTHIAVTSLWVMPVIAARPTLRIAYMIGSAVLFHSLSEQWYYQWVMTRPGIDGGPLGFLTWTVPMLVGSLAYDAVAHPGSSSKRPLAKMLAWSAVLMLLGYALACLNQVAPPNAWLPEKPWSQVLVEPPFVPPSDPVNIWTMTQRAGSVSYLTFSAGFSLAVYALFYAACDLGTFRLGLFRTLGTNALAGYIVHDLVGNALSPVAPKDSPLWWVATLFAIFFAICYAILRYLEKNKLYLKL